MGKPHDSHVNSACLVKECWTASEGQGLETCCRHTAASKLSVLPTAFTSSKSDGQDKRSLKELYVLLLPN